MSANLQYTNKWAKETSVNVLLWDKIFYVHSYNMKVPVEHRYRVTNRILGTMKEGLSHNLLSVEITYV